MNKPMIVGAVALIMSCGTILVQPAYGQTASTSIANPRSVGANHSSQNLRDLAIGKPYMIGTQWPDATFAAGQSSWPNNGQLTDGKYASVNFLDRAWIQLARQGGRSVTVDLGGIHQVNRVSLDFLQNLSVGIVFPDNVSYYASDNGKTWHRLGTAWSTKGGGSSAAQTQEYGVQTNVKARYIRAQFEDNVLSFLDEMSVYGPAGSQSIDASSALPGPGLSTMMGDNYLVDPKAPGLPNLRQALSTLSTNSGTVATSGTTHLSGSQVKSAIAKFASLHVTPKVESPVGPNADAGDGYLLSSDSSTAGIKNMVTADIYGHGSLGEWSKQEFMPMVAKENSNGKPTGWLFDGFLFSYFSNPTTSSGMSAWVNDLFSSTSNLSQLNAAVSSLKQQLKDPSYKEKVVIAIPGLTSNPSAFGSIGSASGNLDLNPADVGAVQSSVNKIKVVRWYISQVLQKWKAAHLSNLKLAGFYWQPEALNLKDPLDPELIQATSYTVHQSRLKFYWIPYDGAPGISEWRQLGFDDVTIQPNVSFHWNIDPQSRLQSVAEQARFYHTGIEMEMHWDAVSSNLNMATTAQNKYYDYFTGGNLYGYEGPVMKTWYLGTKNMLTAYQSTNPFYHQLYNKTVQFIDGEWTSTVFH